MKREVFLRGCVCRGRRGRGRGKQGASRGAQRGHVGVTEVDGAVAVGAGTAATCLASGATRLLARGKIELQNTREKVGGLDR